MYFQAKIKRVVLSSFLYTFDRPSFSVVEV